MSNNFYRAFEEEFRGSRELIKNRLNVYLPFIQPLLKIYPEAEAIDLGCGRGEWLELLSDNGFQPKGIDLDAGMLEACQKIGLKAEQGDAFEYITSLPDESMTIVSAFHVVEHINFEQLHMFVSEALRVLKPGGILIMETPNAENIVVATQNFYLDPTHQRPVPSMLLNFIAKYAGFERVKVLRLQESQEIADKVDVSLRDVFAEVSPDYAIVAQKLAEDNVLSQTTDAFCVDYGMSLDDLLHRWDRRFEIVEAKVKEAEIRAKQAEELALNLYQNAQNFERTLNDLYASNSWKITAPLRWFGAQVRLLCQDGFKSRLKAMVIKILRQINQQLLARPLLRNRLINLSKKIGFYTKVRLIYRRFKVQQISQSSLEQSSSTVFNYRTFDQMTPRAKQLYVDLETAIAKKQKEKS